MVMSLAFHTKDPYGMGGVLNIFLFPDLSPLTWLEAALLTQKWDLILGGGTLNFFTDTILMMGKKKVVPIAGWDKAESQVEAWAVFSLCFGETTRSTPPLTRFSSSYRRHPGSDRG